MKSLLSLQNLIIGVALICQNSASFATTCDEDWVNAHSAWNEKLEDLFSHDTYGMRRLYNGLVEVRDQWAALKDNSQEIELLQTMTYRQKRIVSACELATEFESAYGTGAAAVNATNALSPFNQSSNWFWDLDVKEKVTLLNWLWGLRTIDLASKSAIDVHFGAGAAGDDLVFVRLTEPHGSFSRKEIPVADFIDLMSKNNDQLHEWVLTNLANFSPNLENWFFFQRYFFETLESNVDLGCLKELKWLKWKREVLFDSGGSKESTILDSNFLTFLRNLVTDSADLSKTKILSAKLGEYHFFPSMLVQDGHGKTDWVSEAQSDQPGFISFLKGCAITRSTKNRSGPYYQQDLCSFQCPSEKSESGLSWSWYLPYSGGPDWDHLWKLLQADEDRFDASLLQPISAGSSANMLPVSVDWKKIGDISYIRLIVSGEKHLKRHKNPDLTYIIYFVKDPTQFSEFIQKVGVPP